MENTKKMIQAYTLHNQGIAYHLLSTTKLSHYQPYKLLLNKWQT